MLNILKIYIVCNLPFLPERMKIDKCKKLVCNLYDKKLHCSHKIIKASLKSWVNIKQFNFIKKHGLNHIFI